MKWLCPHCKAINAEGAGLCHNCAKKTPMPAGFDHPCRDHCSGWKQGFERGQEALQVEVARMREALIAIFNTDHTRGCPEGACNCHKQIAWNALEKMPVQTELGEKP